MHHTTDARDPQFPDGHDKSIRIFILIVDTKSGESNQIMRFDNIQLEHCGIYIVD